MNTLGVFLIKALSALAIGLFILVLLYANPRAAEAASGLVNMGGPGWHDLHIYGCSVKINHPIGKPVLYVLAAPNWASFAWTDEVSLIGPLNTMCLAGGNMSVRTTNGTDWVDWSFSAPQ